MSKLNRVNNQDNRFAEQAKVVSLGKVEQVKSKKTFTFSELGKFFKMKLGYRNDHEITFKDDYDVNNQKNGWTRYWDNDKRVKITMHEDLLETIRHNIANGIDTDNLGIQPTLDGEVRTAKTSGKEYRFFRIVRYSSGRLSM